MKYWICPKCACVNSQSVTKCDGCSLPAEAVLLLPIAQWVEFPSNEELDKWIAIMQKSMGSKIWRRR